MKFYIETASMLATMPYFMSMTLLLILRADDSGKYLFGSNVYSEEFFFSKKITAISKSILRNLLTKPFNK